MKIYPKRQYARKKTNILETICKDCGLMILWNEAPKAIKCEECGKKIEIVIRENDTDKYKIDSFITYYETMWAENSD